MIGYQDVLRLQVPVIDPNGMAVFYGIQDLKKDSLGKIILTDILATLGDIVEQITLRAKLQNDIDTVGVVDDLQHRYHIRMCGCEVVKTYFPGLECHLSTIQGSAVGVELAEALYGISNAGLGIQGRVHDAIGTCSENPG
jgi:hypothetical protein